MKKINFTKIIVLFLVASMLLGMLVACTDGATDATDGTETGKSTETDAPETFFELVKEGTLVPVVYGTYAQGKEIALARSIIDGVNRFVPVKGRPESEGKYDPNKVEILVGHTTYPETEQVLNELGYGEGAVKIVGNKMVVVGFDDDALEKAIVKLIDECYNSKDDNKNIFIKSSFAVNVTSNSLVSALPVHPDISPNVVNTTRDCYLLDFGENRETEFNEYVELLEKADFKLYAENVLEENEYYTYVNDELVVNMIFTKYNRKFKLTVESLSTTELPPRAEDNVYTPVPGLKSLITQVGLFYNVTVDQQGAMTNFNGMCYVIRLDDGSFIVVDGGHGDPTQVDNLYNTMKKQAPNPDNIVIAAWFFSHDHGDHTQTFQPFVNKYKDMVTVERFIYNFPSEEQGNTNTVYKNIQSYISGFFKEAKIVKAHPGQVFHIRNSKITILYTMDVYESEKLSDTNNASIVWQMELEGKKFMCLGDYSESSLHLKKLYSKETLKSDIVQIAHHGISGQDGSIYPIIEPEYAFWPVGAYHVIFHSNGNIPDLELDKKSFNDYFMKTMDQSKVFLAKDDFVVMTIDDGNISTQIFENNEDFMANYKN